MTTPITEQYIGRQLQDRPEWVDAELCRDFERELAAAHEELNTQAHELERLLNELAAAQERIRELETALLGVKEYREKNPLGGPAKVFDAMADAIRAGDDFNAVCADYGWCPLDRAIAAEARAEAMAEELHSWERTFCSSGEFSPALRDYRAAHQDGGAK